MRKVFFILLLFTSVTLSGQLSEGGLPPSLNNTTLKAKARIAVYALNSLDTTQLLAYDSEHPTPMRYSVIKDVSIDIKSSGTKTYLDNYKGTIWQYKVTAQEAKSIQIILEKYRVPDNAQLFIYDENYSLIKGAFTSLNMTDDLSFVIADFPGQELIIEYFEPENASFEGEVVIGGIGQAYIDILDPKSVNADEYNLINVNCEEGIKWQYQKHSVCKITYNDGLYSYLCTGSLLNNTRNDGTPYFLTANHCVNTTTAAGTLVAYFNYETIGCSSSSVLSPLTLSGSTLKTTGTSSDYTLLLLSSSVPVSYLPYYAGWDVSGSITDSTTGIHHPKGWVKKISVDHDASASNTTEINWSGGSVSPVYTHWAVLFDEGTTYGGSSGSPLFDENQKVIGQLHGGSTTDYYGKLSYSWTHPKTGYLTLKSFLDPDNTGVNTVEAFIPEGVKTDPQFLCDFSSVCVASPIKLTGFSAFDPTDWSWSFLPNTVTFHDGTSSTSQSPVVSFNNSGSYTIALSATNTSGTNTREVLDLISAGTNLSLKVVPAEITDSCSCSFTRVELEGFGADAYLWELTGDAASLFSITNETANPVEITPVSALVSAADITLKLTGTQGTCSTTLAYSLPLEAQPNDNIENAILLTNSTNGPFSNKCATIEAGEPEPPHTDCTSQLSWCDEYGTGLDIIENTVWFYYIPATNERVTLYSTGMDNEMAIYQADNYSDVLSGNATLIAANDDYTATDYNPKLTNLELSSNKKYWIQVDGSAGGATGTFNLVLSAVNGIEDVNIDDIDIIVFPQPACDNVFIQSSEFLGLSSVLIELYNSAGSKVATFIDTEGNSKIEIPLAGLPSGIYFARITFDEKRTTVKIMK